MTKSFPATPESVAAAVHAVEAAMRGLGVPADVVDRVTLAVGEAAGNAVEHGCEKDPGRVFEVSWELDSESFQVSVEDDGMGLDPELLRQAALPADPLSTRGRGLYLIRELADEVRLEAGGRRVAMRFDV